MGLFDMFKKQKNTTKCHQCMRLINGKGRTIEDRAYCTECYNQKMVIFQQTASPSWNKQTDQGPESNREFVCKDCKKTLAFKYCHADDLCEECYARGGAEAAASEAVSEATEYLDDITFVRAMRHITSGPWHQYDVLLAAKGYGWDLMKEWADYMADADLQAITHVVVSALGAGENEIIASYVAHGSRCQSTPELECEGSALSVAGMSKILHAPTKIVWFNQTKTLRIFTLVEDDLLMQKYVETMVRRTFGTENAMKLGKSIPQDS